MGNSGKYADLILPLALSQAYTFAVPPDLEKKIKLGQRVMVQFGPKRIYSALIWKIHSRAPDEEAKPILGILDENPLISITQFRFWEWISEYYLCTMGEVMNAALPAGLKLESQTKIHHQKDFDLQEELNDLEENALTFIKNNPGTNLMDLGKLMKRKNPIPLVNSLLHKNAIQLEEKLVSGYKPKEQMVISLSPELAGDEDISRILNSLTKAPAQEKCLMAFLDLTGPGNFSNKEIPLATLIKHCENNRSAVNALIKKGIFLKSIINISRIGSGLDNTQDIKKLTPEQQKAFDKIKLHFKSKKVSLLHGVTSSGKTEIYIHLIKNQLEKGKQVLYLLPEIALTAQIINRLRAVFGEKVGIFHSRFSDAERVEVWKESSGESENCNIVLGARSAVFLPFHNLGLIIVDEEHEISYKQLDPAPRYQARDAAIVLARLHGANVLLGSATPSLESFYNARSGKFGLVELNERYSNIQMPEIFLSNTKEAYRKKKMKGHFTSDLLTAIDDALINKEQVILFQNRRGYSPYMQCDNCGHIPKCRDCDVSLTVHKFQPRLICHYCGYNEKLPQECPECNSTGILAKGLGTEKIEDEIQILFPDAKIARLDLDAARSKKGYSRIIEDFENLKTDILIGTQMISKGLDFDNVKLVGIVNADNLLHFPDFRSFERSFQLITQVSGRAGRKNSRGIVIVQTSDPTHRILQQVIQNDYENLYKWEMTERQAFNYPPYSRLIKLTFKHRDAELVARAAHVFARELRINWPMKILGPQTPPVSRVQQLYIKTILIKSGKGQELKELRNKIKETKTRMKETKTFRPVIIQADVDPV